MANHTHNNKFLGADSDGWLIRCTIGLIICVFVGIYGLFMIIADPNGHGTQLMWAAAFVFLSMIWAWILAGARGRQVRKEQEGQIEIQRFLSSPNSSANLKANPDLYRLAQAELQARQADAVKMQKLHALRQEVEEGERKAGIFAPTLLPTRSQADPMAAEMARLAQRRVEAERQKHLMKSVRSVEDAEWEADDA